MKFYLLAILMISVMWTVNAVTFKEEPSGEPREPRVSGRIVKVYSGTRPEPVLCTNEGFRADPVNCAVFYRCVKERSGKFSVFRYQCAPGTVYDPDVETCNFPRNTRRTECGGIMKPIFSRKQINEVKGVHKEVPQPISTFASIFTEKSTKPSTISSHKYEKLITSTINYDANIFNKYFSAFTTKYPWTSTTVHKNEIKKYWPADPMNSSPKPNQSGTAKKDVCYEDGFTGDFENCRKFYRCVGNHKGGFMRYEFFCSESTVWDDDLQSCNHPWSVKRSKCGRSLNPNLYETDAELLTTVPGMKESGYGYKTDKTMQQQLQISHGSKVSQTQTQISHSENVIQNQTQINYGNSTNNSKQSEAKQNQTQISHGSAVSQTQTQIDYGNNGMQTQLQIDHSKDSSQSQTQIHESTTKEPSTPSQQSQQGTNNNQCVENGFIGDSNNCKKFYRCVDNGRGSFTRYEYLCGEGTVWDSKIESCNHAWAVKECGSQAATESNKEELTTTTAKSTSGTTKTTQGYQITTTESPDVDIDGGYGSNQGSSGDTTSVFTTSTTEKANNKSSDCTSSGFIGDANNCKIFYRCVDNGKGFTKHEFKCGEGTLWDPEIEACNHAWAVKRCGGNSPTHKEETTTIKETTLGVQTTVTLLQTTTQSSTVNDEDVSYGPPEKPSSSTVKSTTTLHSQDDECVSSGFMGDSKNCKKFYRCVDNGNGGFTKHEFTCGEGTVWDPKIDACNHAWAVENCGGSSNNQQEIQSGTKRPTSSPQTTVTDKNTDYPSTELTSISSFTTTSTADMAIGDECTSSGFMGDSRDCKKFYRCVDNGDGTYTRYEFTCGEGTVWDSEIEACNHVWAVEKCGGSKEPSSSSESTVSQQPILNEEDHDGTTQSSENSETTSNAITSTHSIIVPESNDCTMEGYFGDKNDCKKFYRCIDDGNDGYYRYNFQCGEGTVWDDSIRSCNHAWAVKECGSSNVQQSSTQSSADISQDGNHKPTEESTSEMSSNTHATQKPQTTQGVCNSEGFYGDSSDCKKFYRCVDDGKGGYTKYDFVCGDGTSWNQEIKACDHESDDNSCLSSTSPGSTSTDVPLNTTTSSATTTETHTQDNSNINSSTTEQCTSEGFFAHSQDCKKFIRCVSNGNNEYTKYEFSCGEGTVWVQEIKACDHDYGDCESQNSSSSRPQNSENSSTTSSSVENQTPGKENDDYEESNQPPQNDESHDECASEGYYENSKDCTKFYRCVDNGNGGYTKYDFTCGEGTAWDTNIQTCNHINEVESCSGKNNDETQTEQTPKDEQSQTTQSSSSTTQHTSSSSKDTCEEEGYFGDSQDCKKFYRCVDNGKGGLTKYDFVCGEGTIWDQDITNCNHPQDVSNPSCSSNQGESASSSSSETTTISMQSSSGTTENQTEKPGGGNQNVTCDKAGFYPNPNDCKKFYRCVDWDGEGKRFSVYHFECGEGTIWDPALDTCNHEESVYPPRNCSGSQSQSQSETTTEQSTTEESTTTEQTTTEQSTTSDQTTTQESTTSKQTTTQQSTTREHTTTQQSTTSEQTTTQQSTTSEQTTQQQTTSEQTTQQSTTTSQETSEQTTQESTTNEQSTTQESTTSEQTTEEATTASTTEQNKSTTDQSSTDSTTTEGQESTTETSSSSSGDCPETEDDQYVLVCPTSFKRHPKYCNMFYQCVEDEETHDVNVAMFKCPNETIYDENQMQCVEQNKADKKCEGEMARQQRLRRLSHQKVIVVDNDKKSCPNVGYYAFEKSECSPAFLRCEKHKSGKLRGFVNQCPKGYIFWSRSKRCERTATVRDCKRSTNDWTDRWNIPIDTKNVSF